MHTINPTTKVAMTFAESHGYSPPAQVSASCKRFDISLREDEEFRSQDTYNKQSRASEGKKCTEPVNSLELP